MAESASESRKSIKVAASTHERLDDAKDYESMTFDETITELLETAEALGDGDMETLRQHLETAEHELTRDGGGGKRARIQRGLANLRAALELLA